MTGFFFEVAGVADAAETDAASNAVSALRASPDASRMSAARASSSSAYWPASPRSSATALSITTPRSSSLSVSSVSSRDRESNGEMTENEGFSVVAATRMTQPFSTPGSRASCCALVNRWISSRNNTVETP